VLLLIVNLQAAGQSGPPLRVGVDRRVELFAILFKLAGAGEFKGGMDGH